MKTRVNPVHRLAIGLATLMTIGFAAAAPAPGDADITAKIKADMAGAKVLEKSEIEVTTRDGVVTLEGTASSEVAKAAATARARSIAGVKRVDNKLKTYAGRSPKVAEATAKTEGAASDTWITTKVKSEILADGAAKGSKLHVSTIRGVVVLAGSMPSQAAADRVRDIAAKVEGVKRVDSSGLKVAP